VVPLPRYRGGGWCERSRPRDAVRVRVLPTKATNLLPPKNKGRRSAEKAQLSRGATPRIGCCHPNALRARPRVQRDALAFRRSTAALASAICRSSIQAALHAMQCAGVTCAFGIPLKRNTSRAGRNAGGIDARDRPRAAVTSRRPQEPHPPRQSASPVTSLTRAGFPRLS
jgi:hypothetical protein